MADVDRKARIAAARKKLKQIQKTNQTTTSNSTNELKRIENEFNIMDVSSHSAMYNPIARGSDNQRRSSLDTLKSSPSNKVSQIDLAQSSKSTSVTTLSADKLISFSKQVSGAMNESTAYLNGDISNEPSNNIDDLEKRNHDLAERLDKLSQNNNLLHEQLEEMKKHNDRLQHSLESERRTFEEKLKRDLSALKEQLQVHVQTVGILVAEKTELQSACNQSTKLAETRQAEVEELAGRLKASRQRVTDLEKNLSTSNSTNQKLDKNTKELTKDLERLKMETYKNNKSREELQQHNLELQGRLQQKIHEITNLEDTNIELKGKLEMNELYLEQLKNGQDRPDSNVTKQIEKILTEKTELQTKLQQQEDALKMINRERESMMAQYNQYIEQLQQHNKDLQHQNEKLLKERHMDSLKLDDLETSLNHLKSKQAEVTDDRIHEHEEKTRLMETAENLMSQLMAASKNLEVQVADNSQLSRLVIEKEQSILELEQQLEKVSSSTVDQDKLIETIQSDKIALSRAMAQNKELKTQFLELQEQFVKMSQKNMEAMTKLQGEEHNSRDLRQRFCIQEEEIKELRQLVIEKSRSLEELSRQKEIPPIVNGAASSNSSSEDDEKNEEIKKMAELFQRKVPLIENLQKELSSAQDNINALTNHNSELKIKIASLENLLPITNDLSTNERPGPNVDLLKTTITQLEMEKQHVNEQLKESLKMQTILKEKLEDMQGDLARQAPATMNGDIVTRVHFEALQHAMQQLEDKYTRTMRDKAELVDKNERLEHIILQLQGETDTIGEYVSLYHQQRYLMKQKTAERENHITRLFSERSELQGKFRQLQALVVQLLKERNNSTPEGSVMDFPVGSVALQSTLDSASDSLDLNGGSETSMSKPGKRKMDVNGEGAEDWPDYSESSDEDNQTKPGKRSSTSDDFDLVDLSQRGQVQTPPSSPKISSSQKASNIPTHLDSTVLKIMNLLTEIDSSTNDKLLRIPFFCRNCTGDVLLV